MSGGESGGVLRDRAEARPQTVHRYSDGTDTMITVICPWGAHSGNIPPPIITFGNRSFAYYGSDHS